MHFLYTTQRVSPTRKVIKLQASELPPRASDEIHLGRMVHIVAEPEPRSVPLLVQMYQQKM